MTTHHYQMWKFKIVDPIQYVWHAGDDDTTLYTTTLTADAPPAVHVLLGDVDTWQLKCHAQFSAVAMLRIKLL